MQTVNEPGTLNLVVFFSDGLPNGLTADYPIKKLRDTRFSFNSTGSLTTMDPSPCVDAAGHSFDREPGDVVPTYFNPNWNPFWNPQPKTGVIAGTGNAEDNTGSTFGLTNTEANSVSDHNRHIIPDHYG